ncbi:hypothetical protein [Streptomyces sp. NPDC049881]|uniref:hypothetical protein n=1 Tax=Streptomyces sp. NPDC049881 TaxID=3155778 RepID=UPI003446BC23
MSRDETRDETPACLLCDDALPDGETDRQACTTCQARLARQLRALPALYHDLAHALRPGPGAPGPRVTGGGSTYGQAPVNEGALDLRAWGGMVSALQAHEDDWRRVLKAAPAPARGSVEGALTAAVEFLGAHLWWACQSYPHVDGLANDVRQLRAAALSILSPPTGDSTRLGPCPAQYEDGTLCGATLRYIRGADSITCRRCGSHYRQAAWLALAADNWTDEPEGAPA